ncbi:conserved hypothetical protein [Neospora caninum Liverpool]|nr:conserved hypothetical protein [Neospora caninum Liverpool]CBZ55093.1 conserved hypothetical protein [Neospora caninum Liverpool]|eukprot:XP_003885121.1 conserved hypothetical protein [Neospora caninum Liverpool]
MTPVANLVQAATTLLREHRSRPLLVCPPRDVSPEEQRPRLSRKKKLPRSRTKETRSQPGTAQWEESPQRGVRVGAERGLAMRGVRTPREQERSLSSSSASLPSQTEHGGGDGGRQRREDHRARGASSSSRPLSPTVRRAEKPAQLEETDEEDEGDCFANLSFHTRLDGADPTSDLEVATCCIDGRGWCFFTVQGTEPSRATRPLLDTVRSSTDRSEEGTQRRRKPEGVLLCLDTGVVTPVIHPVFFPTSVDPARVLLPSVAAHPVGGITCAVGQAAVTIRRPLARRTRRRRAADSRAAESGEEAAEGAETEEGPRSGRSRESIEIGTERGNRGEDREEEEGRGEEEGRAALLLQRDSASFGGEAARSRDERCRRRRGESDRGESGEERGREMKCPEDRRQTDEANGAGGASIRRGGGSRGEYPTGARRAEEARRKDVCPREAGEVFSLSAPAAEENYRARENQEDGLKSEHGTRDAPLGVSSEFPREESWAEGLGVFFSSSTSPSVASFSPSPSPSPGCADRRDRRGESGGAPHAGELRTREEDAQDHEEEEQEEEENEAEANEEEEGTRSDWWFYPVDEDEPWNLVPMMEVMNSRDLHELAQQTTLNFGGSLENSVCIYAFDRYSACCWLLWQPGRSVREHGKGDAAVSLECAYLIQLPAQLYWREAQRCLLALRAKQRRDRRREREARRRRRERRRRERSDGRGAESSGSSSSDREGTENDEAFMASAAASLFGPGACDTSLVPGGCTPGGAPYNGASAPPALLHIISQDARHLEVREMLPTSTGHLLIMAEAGNKLKKSTKPTAQVASPGAGSLSPPALSLVRASTIAARGGTLHDSAVSEQGGRGASQPRRSDAAGTSSTALLPGASLFASLSSTLAWAAAPSGVSPRSEAGDGSVSEAGGASSIPSSVHARRLGAQATSHVLGSPSDLFPGRARETASASASGPGAFVSSRLPPMTASGVSTAGGPLLARAAVPHLPLGSRASDAYALQQSHVLAAAADPEGEEGTDCDAVLLFLLDGLLQCEASAFQGAADAPSPSAGGGRDTWADSARSRKFGGGSGRRGMASAASSLLGEKVSGQGICAVRRREIDAQLASSAGFPWGLDASPRETGSVFPLRASSAPSSFPLSPRNARAMCCFCRLRCGGGGCGDGVSLSEDFFGLWSGAPASSLGSGRLALHRNFLDVEICCSDGVRLPSHRALLAAKSAFFEAMLTGACVWREQEPQSDRATGRRDGIWILNLPSHSSRVVAPILQYLATDKLMIPSRCCCSRCCPFLKSGTNAARDASGTAGEPDPCCSRCMYTWLLELFACAEFCLLQPLQLEILHLACRYINKHSALFALCSPWTAPHPRLLRFAAQTLMLHFPCPSAFLRPQPSLLPADLCTSGHSGDVDPVLAAERGTSQHLGDGQRKEGKRGEAERKEAPLSVLARAPVLPHICCAVNAWFMTSSVCSPVVAHLVQQLLSARKPLCRKVRAKWTNPSGEGREPLQASLAKATLLFIFGYRMCLPGYSTFSPDILLVLPELREPQSEPRDRSALLLPGADYEDPDDGCDPMHWPGRGWGERALQDPFTAGEVPGRESFGLVEIWGKALGLSREVRRRVERELQGIIATMC